MHCHMVSSRTVRLLQGLEFRCPFGTFCSGWLQYALQKHRARIDITHCKYFSYGKPASQISFFMLRKFVMHFYNYDTFALHMQIF